MSVIAAAISANPTAAALAYRSYEFILLAKRSLITRQTTLIVGRVQTSYPPVELRENIVVACVSCLILVAKRSPIERSSGKKELKGSMGHLQRSRSVPTASTY